MSLEDQLGQYATLDPDEAKANALNIREGSPLFQGVSEYQNKRTKLIKQFIPPPELDSAPESSDSYYFRKLLTRFIETSPAKPYPQPTSENDPRLLNPEEQAINLEKLLGKKGAKLYQLALEEERYDKNYLKATLHESTHGYEGVGWKERPVIFIGGPSASGKSYAAKTIVQQMLPSLNPTDQKKWLVSVDGGICREVSQVRNLVVNYANHLGYPGIKDLHSKSKILTSVKKNVEAHACQHQNLGMIIPDTFATKGPKIVSFFRKYQKLTQTRVLFSRVVGTDAQQFQNVVRHMGNNRAWKREFAEPAPQIGFQKTQCESKKYETRGFLIGYVFSMIAELIYKAFYKKPSCITVSNDLIRVDIEEKDRQFKLKKLGPDEPGGMLISPSNENQIRQALTAATTLDQARKIMQQKRTEKEPADDWIIVETPEHCDADIIDKMSTEAVASEQRFTPDESSHETQQHLKESLALLRANLQLAPAQPEKPAPNTESITPSPHA